MFKIGRESLGPNISQSGALEELKELGQEPSLLFYAPLQRQECQAELTSSAPSSLQQQRAPSVCLIKTN